MLSRIVEARPLDGYRVHLRFADGAAGVVDIAALIPFDGVFAPLADRSYFERISVHPELQTIYWPNGADLDPDVLYAQIRRVNLDCSPQQEV